MEFLNDEGLLIETSECPKVKAEFEKQGVDAIFIINCNFGNEEAAGQIAKMMNLPTLLWGPQDTVFEEDGTLAFETNAADDDLLYDEISSGLLIAEIKRNRQELLESLTLYYRVFILGEDVSALLEEED